MLYNAPSEKFSGQLQFNRGGLRKLASGDGSDAAGTSYRKWILLVELLICPL
jgi:hypothetical protein